MALTNAQHQARHRQRVKAKKCWDVEAAKLAAVNEFLCKIGDSWLKGAEQELGVTRDAFGGRKIPNDDRIKAALEELEACKEAKSCIRVVLEWAEDLGTRYAREQFGLHVFDVDE